VQDISDGVKRVVITIRSGKDYDSEFHCVLAPCGIRGSFILAQSCDFGLHAANESENNAQTRNANEWETRRNVSGVFSRAGEALLFFSRVLSALDFQPRPIRGVFSKASPACSPGGRGR
jgi:hypothetical protein